MNIKKHSDVFGQVLVDSFNGEDRTLDIIEREDGYVDAALVKNDYFSDYKEWPEIEKLSMKYVRGKVLDVGCGAGRVSLYLQKKGFDVTGIDLSPLAVKVCKLRKLKKVKVLSIEKIDSLRPNLFDAVIMLGNNFGLFRNRSKIKTLLGKIDKIVSDDGIIIAETLNPYNTKNPAHLAYHKFNIKRGRMAGQIKMRLRHKNLIGNWFDYLFVSEKEMKELFVGTGWKIKNIINSQEAQYIAFLEKSKQE